MRRGCWFVLASCLACMGLFAFEATLVEIGVSAPTVAHAQDRERARAAYSRGQQLFDAGRYQEAEAAFQEAYRHVSNPVVLIAIADTYQRRGDQNNERRYLERYLREAPTADNASEIAARVQRLGGSAAAGPATFVIRSTPTGANVALNGTHVGRTPYEAEVGEGRYRIQVYADGYEPLQQSVTVRPGQREVLDITLDRVGGGGGQFLVNGQVDSGGAGRPNAVTWALVGVTGAALVTGTTMGIMALRGKSDFNDNPTESRADRTERRALIADVSFGVAAAAAVTGLVLYLTGVGQQDGRAESDGSRRRNAHIPMVAPVVSENGGGVAASLQF